MSRSSLTLSQLYILKLDSEILFHLVSMDFNSFQWVRRIGHWSSVWKSQRFWQNASLQVLQLKINLTQSTGLNPALIENKSEPFKLVSSYYEVLNKNFSR